MQGNPKRNWIAIGVAATAIVRWLGWGFYYSDSPEGKKAAAESEARRKRAEKADAADRARADAAYEERHGKNMGSYKNKYTGDDMDVTKLPDGTLSIKN